MIEFDTRQLHGLEWRQESAFSHHYKLQAGDSVLAELNFLKTFGTLAEASTSRHKWTFKRRGILTSTVGARRAGEEAEIAVYHPNWTAHKGLLRLESGEELTLRTTNFWGSEWILSNSSGEVLLRFHNRGVLRHGAQMDVEQAALAHPQLELLLTLAWYILVLHQLDSTAVVAGS